MTAVRTRFAPSPTGFLHLGSARTALYNWAYARRHGGTFVLRIEDTDRDRSTKQSEEAVLEGMRWLGLDWDEGPYRQTERSERHAEVVKQLIDSGDAYRCTCTKERLEELRARDEKTGGRGVYDGHCRDLQLGADCGEHTVRVRLPQEGMLGFDDLVYGPSGQDAAQIGDVIIARSDGSPLFHLAVVVDDLDMGITHVIRGADHHPNTPLQIALYRALGAEPPVFAHVPLIVGAGGKKLSKRRDNVSIQQFRDEGHVHEALVNWIVRLGWSHGDDEVFSLDDIARLFDLDHVGRSAAQADEAKLAWLGQHWLKEMAMDDLVARLGPHLAAVAGAEVPDTPALRALLDLLRERSHTLVEMATQTRWYVCDEIEIDEKAAKKHLRPAALDLLKDLVGRLEAIAEADWNEAALEPCFEATVAAHDTKMGKLAQPVRVAVTGGPNSPGIYETVAIVGRERTLARLGDAVSLIEARAAEAEGRA